MNALIGRKLGMTRVFDDEGAAVPVTVIAAGPCPVVQVTETRVQLGFDARKPTRTPKALLGHVKGAGLERAPRVLRSFPVASLRFRTMWFASTVPCTRSSSKGLPQGLPSVPAWMPSA